MAMIGSGDRLPLPSADPDEPVDILSFVVTKAGWEALKKRISISSLKHVRILTQLIYQPASELINQSGAEWRYLPSNHAKAILYRKKNVAVLGSFNLTNPSLSSSIECFHRIDDPTHYNQLAETFDRHWKTAKQDKAAFATQEKVLAAMIGQEEDKTGQDAPNRGDDLPNGPREPWPFQEEIIQQVMTWPDTARGADLGRIVFAKAFSVGDTRH